jgi:hypothetical protein
VLVINKFRIIRLPSSSLTHMKIYGDSILEEYVFYLRHLSLNMLTLAWGFILNNEIAYTNIIHTFPLTDIHTATY